MRTDLSAHLGSIEWDLAPMWSVAPRVDNKNVGLNETNLLSLSYGCVIRKDINAIGGLRPESYETYNIIEPGDVVLRMTDLQNDQKSIRTGQTFERGLITSAYITVRPDQHKVEPRFLAAVLRAYDIRKTYYKMGAGVRQNLGYSEFTDLPIPLPALTTQRRIADYLDRETGEIDTMIVKIDELASALHERKSNAVDRVLSLSEAAACGLGVLFSFHNGDRGSNYPARSEFVSEGIPFINAGHLVRGLVTTDKMNFITVAHFERMGGAKLRDGDILFCLRGSVGKFAEFSEPYVTGALASSLVAMRARDGILNRRFIQYALGSAAFAAQISLSLTGSAQPNLSVEQLAQLRVPFPASDEQKRIADHLDEVTSRINTMLAKVTELKALLIERRAALITDVVTGRKDVA